MIQFKRGDNSMKLYNKKTVADYIMGNDIEGFSVDELEDNVEFMMDVLKMTSDKEMYNFCSDKVKNDPEFVSFVIRLFAKDEEFIATIADKFLSKIKNNSAPNVEVLVLMAKLIPKSSPRFLKYGVMLYGLQLEKDTSIVAAKELYKNDPEELSCIGETGFTLLYDEYQESEIVTDYFAEKAIEKILHTDSAEFEDLFHRLFKSQEELEKVNMRSYLIDYISNLDSELASYISTHIYTLDFALREIETLKNKWNSYGKRIEAKKFSMMFQKIHMYMEENGHNCSYTEDELLYSISNDLGITKEICRNDPSMPSDEQQCEEEMPDISRLENSTMAYDDLVHYNSIREIITKYYNANSLKDLEDLEEEYGGSSEDSDEIDGMLGELGLTPDGTEDKKPSNVIDFRSAINKKL